MNTHHILHVPSQTEVGSNSSLENALKAAIHGARLSQVLAIVIKFNGNSATVHLHDEALSPLFEIYTRLPGAVGRPRGPDKPEAEFNFNGRPSASGWLKCETRCELLLPEARKLIANLQKGYYLVYMTRKGSPVGVVEVPRVVEEAMAQSSEKVSGSKQITSVPDIAIDMAASFLLDEAPSGAVGVFLVHWDGRNLKPVVKRVTAGLLKASPYTYTKLKLRPQKFD